MLQEIPARPFFRALEVPLGLAIVGVGVAAVYFIIQIAWMDHWGFAFLIPSAIGVAVLGVLLLIHAATNCFPEWVVGRDENELASPRPNEEL